jgi:Flp pilus assembly protein TadD
MIAMNIHKTSPQNGKNSNVRYLLSAIISTYNSEKFIGGCIEDLEAQTLADQVEIIVVDSQSEENEQPIVRKLQKKYDNIRYVRTARRETIYQAWNRGIKLASGKYITNANTDDRHRKDAFERMVNLLEMRPDIALVYADLLKTETPNETFENCTPVGRFSWYDWDRSKLLNQGCFIGPQPMWRRSVHDIYGYFDDEFVTSGDYEFWLRISQTLNFHHIREPLGLYLIRPDSIEHREARRKQAEDKKIHSIYLDAQRKGEVIRLRQNIDSGHDSSQKNTPIQPQKNTGDYAMESYEKFYQSIQPLLDCSDPQNAIAALCNLVNSFPDFARAHNDLGVLYYRSGEKERALNHYEQAAQLEPGNVTFKKNLADYYYVEQGRVEDALRIYVNLLELNPQDVEVLLITGHICVSLQKDEDARVFYNRVLEIEPWNADARNNLDQLKKKTPDFTNNQSPEEMYAQIKPLLDAEDLQPAIEALEKLLAVAPAFALAHNDLGVLCYRAGQKQKALGHYEQAVQIEPGNSTYQKNLADFYFVEQGRVEDALKIYVDVLAAYPEDVEILLITAHICVALHNFEDARVFYNRILEIEPWNADARQNLDKLNGMDASVRAAPQSGLTGRFVAEG